MPDSIVQSVIREVEPLRADETIGIAARKVLDSGLPALPAVKADGSFAGIFGEREFMTALFPGYVGEPGSPAAPSPYPAT
jgi:CBS domain-containing protein